MSRNKTGMVENRLATNPPKWKCISPRMNILTGNENVPPRKWGCDSLTMHIPTENANSSYSTVKRDAKILSISQYVKRHNTPTGTRDTRDSFYSLLRVRKKNLSLCNIPSFTNMCNFIWLQRS